MMMMIFMPMKVHQKQKLMEKIEERKGRKKPIKNHHQRLKSGKQNEDMIHFY
jgi:hypothetical protein